MPAVDARASWFAAGRSAMTQRDLRQRSLRQPTTGPRQFQTGPRQATGACERTPDKVPGEVSTRRHNSITTTEG
ncbi:hypothetical protein NDU88_008340 [Pleurodeles waltl]|uniref:Uncharacterized protein n=1 Tax=Pleurodeles waltl TaxID=8319 RepID=A0AAV7QRH8_PLEWA|nr:hypothetical protein NDU88_008340 [Pleurodeles waltl]